MHSAFIWLLKTLQLLLILALFVNTGKVVFLEMRPASAELPFSLVASPGILSNLLVDSSSKTSARAQRKETLSELVGPLMNVRWNTMFSYNNGLDIFIHVFAYQLYWLNFARKHFSHQLQNICCFTSWISLGCCSCYVLKN